MKRGYTSLLHNFLGTLVSRNSDHDGYWLFGFVDADADVDLLRADATQPFARRAASAFAEQTAKARLAPTIAAAKLELRFGTSRRDWARNGYETLGRELAVIATLVTARGATHTLTCTVWVAPHDARFERRSTRAG